MNTNHPRVTLANGNTMPVPLVNGNGLQGAQAVPQALYRNQSVMSNTAQPQTLFYNLGNNAAMHPQLRPQLVNTSSAAVLPNAPVPQVQRPATFTQSVARPTSGTTDKPQELKHNLDAVQIRIGTCQFIPDTNVTFKTEGLLFSLKGHTFTSVHCNLMSMPIYAAISCLPDFSLTPVLHKENWVTVWFYIIRFFCFLPFVH